MVTGNEIAYTAINSGLIGTPYKELDCQAFVEKVLMMAGMKMAETMMGKMERKFTLQK